MFRSCSGNDQQKFFSERSVAAIEHSVHSTKCEAARETSCEKIILADDDIRYTADAVQRICDLLGRYDMVRPHNYNLLAMGLQGFCASNLYVRKNLNRS